MVHGHSTRELLLPKLYVEPRTSTVRGTLSLPALLSRLLSCMRNKEFLCTSQKKMCETAEEPDQNVGFPQAPYMLHITGDFIEQHYVTGVNLLQ